MLVIDEAFAQAGALCYSNVELFAFEAVSLIESMVESDELLRTLDRSNSTDGNHAENTAFESTCKRVCVSLLNVELFSEELELFGKREGVLRPSARLSVSASQLAMHRLVTMVQETWGDVRSALLNSLSSPACTSPSKFSRNDINNLALATAAAPASNYACCPSGRALLALERHAIRAELGLSSSALFLRFLLYQKLLRLLEAWSRGGVRASDAWASLQGAWGLVDTGEREVAQCVEIGSFPRLLLALGTLDRVLGCGLGLEILTSLCARIAGQTGLLLASTSTSASAPSSSSLHSKADAEFSKTCSYGAEHDTFLSMSPLQAGVDQSAVASVSGWVALALGSSLSLPQPMLELLCQAGVARLFAADTETSLAPPSLCVLLPFGSLRALHADASVDCAMVTSTNVFVGLRVRIDPLLSLQAACERFDWWDRPTAECLKAMAGREADVVGVSDALTRHRVGVRLLDSQYLVADVIPIECLSLVDVTEASSTQSALEDAAEGVSSSNSGRKQKGKRSGKKGAKNQIRRNGQKDKVQPRPSGKYGNRKKYDSDSMRTDNSTMSTTSTAFLDRPGPGPGPGPSPKSRDAERLREELNLAAELNSTNVDVNSPRDMEDFDSQTFPVSFSVSINNSSDAADAEELASSESKHVRTPYADAPVALMAVSTQHKAAGRIDLQGRGDEDQERRVAAETKREVQDAKNERRAAPEGGTRINADIDIDHAGISGKKVHFAASPVRPSSMRPPHSATPIAAASAAVIAPAPFSSYQWMRPNERTSLASLLAEAAAEREASIAAAAAVSNAENPLAFLSVDGRAYQSFAVVRLRGRAQPIVRLPPDAVARSAPADVADKGREHDVVIPAITIAAAASDEDLLRHFSYRARSQSEDEHNLATAANAASARVLGLPDSMGETDKTDDARSPEMGKILESERPEQNEEPDNENPEERCLSDLSAPAIHVRPKPLVYWQRAAWQALAANQPGTFHEVIRNSRAEEEEAIGNMQRQQQQLRLAAAMYAALRSRGRSFLRSSGRPASGEDGGEAWDEGKFSGTGKVVGTNISKMFTAPRQATESRAAHRTRKQSQKQAVSEAETPRDLTTELLLGVSRHSQQGLSPTGATTQDRGGASAQAAGKAQRGSPIRDDSPRLMEDEKGGLGAGAGDYTLPFQLVGDAPTGTALSRSPEEEGSRAPRYSPAMQPSTAQLLDNNKVETTLQAVQSEKYLQLMEDVINSIGAPKGQHISLDAVACTVSVEPRALKGDKQRGASPQDAGHQKGGAPSVSDQQDWADWQVLMSMQQLSKRFPPRGLWSQEEPAPCPYPPQFPPRQPFVQPLWEASARAIRERPRSGLPAAQLFAATAARDAQQARQLNMSVSAERLLVPAPTLLPPLRTASPPRDGIANVEAGRVITVPKPAPNIQSVTSLLTIGSSSFAPLILQSATAATLLSTGAASLATTDPGQDAAIAGEGSAGLALKQQKTTVQMRVPTLPAIARISQWQKNLEIPEEAGAGGAVGVATAAGPQPSHRALSPALPTRARHPDQLHSIEPTAKRSPVSAPRYQDIPILVHNPPPYYEQQAALQKEEESRRVRDSGFNFAPLVDALLKEKDNHTAIQEAIGLGMSSIASMRGGEF
jgi:hypothetical protein